MSLLLVWLHSLMIVGQYFVIDALVFAMAYEAPPMKVGCAVGEGSGARNYGYLFSAQSTVKGQ